MVGAGEAVAFTVSEWKYVRMFIITIYRLVNIKCLIKFDIERGKLHEFCLIKVNTIDLKIAMPGWWQHEIHTGVMLTGAVAWGLYSTWDMLPT